MLETLNRGQAQLLAAHQDPKRLAVEVLAAALEAKDEAPRKLLRELKSVAR